MNLIALQAKPSGKEGRGLGLIPMLLRIWGRLRGEDTDAWDQQLEAHWDEAIRGSSASRAALARSFRDEAAQFQSLEEGVAQTDPA